MEDNTLQLLKESGISENSIVALAQSLSKIEAYIPTKYVNDDSPDLDADNLNHAEQGIKRVTDALNLAIDAITALNSDLEDTVGNNFISYISSTGAGTSNPLDGMKEIYASIPDNKVFEIFASFSGAIVRLHGVKATDLYGVMIADSYSEAINLQYDILDGEWEPRKLLSPFFDTWVTGNNVYGLGLAVQFPYFNDIQITSAQVFNRQTQWENITFTGDIHTCGNTKTVIFDISGTNITEPGPYLVRLSGTMK